MPHRTMAETLEAMGDVLLDEFDALTREAHATYRAYDPAVLIEHDMRAQATCTYTHMVAGSGSAFLGMGWYSPLGNSGPEALAV